MLLHLLGLFALPLQAEQSSQKSKQLENEIETLKEEVLRQKIILRQLEEAVLFGKITSTTTYITFKNLAEGYFTFVEGEFFLDGKLINKLTRESFLKSGGKIAVILDAEVPPGEHLLSTKLIYRVKKQGPFTYVEDYRFDIQSQKHFTIQQGRTRAVDIIVSDRGFFKSELKERLAVSFSLASGS